MALDSGSHSLDRSHGHSSEQSSASLCIPFSGPSGFGHICHVVRLEQVKHHLPLSSHKVIFLVLSYLVHFSPKVVLVAPWWPGQPWFPKLLSLSSCPVKFPKSVLSQWVRGEEDFCNSSLRSILGVDFLKVSFVGLYGPSLVKHLLKSHRQSTIHQYVTSWKSFISFVKWKKPSCYLDTFC